jgi:2'-5' RNA ligase
LTLADEPEVRDLVDLIRRYRDAVQEVQILDPVLDDWLHVTMLELPFVDEIDDTGLSRVIEALRGRLAELPRPDVTFHRPTVATEAVYLRAESSGPLDEVRLAMYDAVAAVHPPGTFRRDRPRPGSFKPHVSFAYVNIDSSAAPIVAALRDVEHEPVTVTFDAVSLVRLSRDHRMWQWAPRTPLRFRV